jgi:hypothetical protein
MLIIRPRILVIPLRGAEICIQSNISVGDVNKLLKKSLACFCCLYLDSNYTKCVNLAWIRTWDVEVLIPKNYGYV